MYESQVALVENMVSSFQRCELSFDGYILQPKKQQPLEIDIKLDGITSPLGTETPPLSPVASAVCNEERLPVELLLKVLSYATLPTLIAFKSTNRFWRAVKLDLPLTTSRLWNCWEYHCYLIRRGWRGSSPGVHGIWELDPLSIQRWMHRLERSIEQSEMVARLPDSFIRFLLELPSPTNSNPSPEYLFTKRPSLPPSPPKSSISFMQDFPLELGEMYLLNHPSWYTEDMYARHGLMPTRYTDLKRPWFTKRDRKLFDKKYHLVRGLAKSVKPKKILPVRRLSPTRGYTSDTSDDGTPEWEKIAPEGPHAFGPNLIHFAQHTLNFSEKVDEWPPAHVLCVHIADLDPVRKLQRRASQPAFLIDLEQECLKSDEMAFLEWCIPDDGVEYHLVIAVEGEMQGFVFVEAERQLLTLVGIDWGEVYERWLVRCAGYISRNDDIAVRER